MSNSFNVCPSESARPPALLGPPGTGGPPGPLGPGPGLGVLGPFEGSRSTRAAGPQELRGPPEVPRRGRDGKELGAPLGPTKAPWCLGVRGLFLRNPGEPQGLPFTGLAGPRASGTLALWALGALGPAGPGHGSPCGSPGSRRRRPRTPRHQGAFVGPQGAPSPFPSRLRLGTSGGPQSSWGPAALGDRGPPKGPRDA